MYEKIDSLCFGCAKIGYNKNNCSHNNENVKNMDIGNQIQENQGKKGMVEPSPENNISNNIWLQDLEINEYGPWTLVSNKKYNKCKNVKNMGRFRSSINNYNTRITEYGKNTNHAHNNSRYGAIISAARRGKGSNDKD